MNIKKFFFPILAIATIIGFVIVNNTGNQDTRKAHENFLLGEFQKINSDQELDNPDMAAIQNYFMTVDPGIKKVPSKRLIEAYHYTQYRKKENFLKSGKEALDWEETGSNMGGRTRAVMWDPNDPQGNKVWAGSVTGGLWFNEDITDDMESWQAVDDYWPNLTISCMVWDPNDSSRFYIGTGEYETARITYRESSGVGVGIWSSTDGGENWELLPATEEFKYISDIKIRDEDGTSVIYAGVVSGIYGGEVQDSEPSEGLYRSEDNGLTWEQVLPDINGEDLPYAPSCVEIGPTGRIFVGTLKNIDGEGGATILYSDNGTTGSWTIFDDYVVEIENDYELNIPGRVKIACAPSDEDIVYAIIGAGWEDENGHNLARGAYVLRSDDGGETWTEKTLPGWDPNWATLSWHAFVIEVSEASYDELYVGGLDVWKSSNGGSSWTKVSDWALMYYGGGDEYVHADQHVQTYKKGDSDILLFGTDGGVFYTEDATSNYPVMEEKNNNYSTLQYYTCDVYPTSGIDIFVGGLQDNGTLVYSGDPLDINDMISGGDGAYCFFDEDEPEILITSTYFNAYRIYVDWEGINWPGTNSGVFINPSDYDSEENIIFANAVTFTGGNSNQLLKIEGVPYYTYENFVSLNTDLDVYYSHVKVSPHSPENSTTLFLGSQDGRLFKVENANTTPLVEEIGDENFPVAYLSSVATGGSEDTLLVTFSNYGVQSVWQSFNGGDNWTDISGNLPDMPIRWGLVHPENGTLAMLATEIGIWTCSNTNDDEIEWIPEENFPNVRVDMLQMRAVDNRVLAATHGRGMMFTTWDNIDINTGVKENGKSDYSIYPNPCDGKFSVLSKNKSIEQVLIFDVNGKIIERRVLKENQGKPIQFDISGQASGIYFVRIGENAQKIILE